MIIICWQQSTRNGSDLRMISPAMVSWILEVGFVQGDMHVIEDSVLHQNYNYVASYYLRMAILFHEKEEEE